MNIKRLNINSASFSEEFMESLRETGFAVLTDEPIPKFTLEDAYDLWQSFFADRSEKLQYTHENNSQVGYFPFRSENAKDYNVKDLKEFFHYYRDTSTPLYLRWTTGLIFEELENISQKLLRIIDAHTGLNRGLDRLCNNSVNTLLRVLHYPPLTGAEEVGAVRSAAHEDINMITLLPMSTGRGLQVKDNDGNWHDVPAYSGDLVVNVGDMLQMMTDGELKSTTHRVVNPDGSDARHSRYSMAMFVHLSPEADVVKGFTAQEYLDQRLKEIGIK